MKKIKIISIIIIVFVIIIGVGFKVCSSCNKDKQITVENDIIAENDKVEVDKNEETPLIVEIPIEENNTQNDYIVPKIEEQESKPISSSKAKTESNKKIENKQDIQSSQANKKIETPAIISKENKTEQNQENTIKTETKKAETKMETKQEETIQINSEWCFEGGSNHIAGDGANEHGYYNTWEEAFKAYEEYTKDWLSSHYKVNQCACGKYYFWAIED